MGAAVLAILAFATPSSRALETAATGEQSSLAGSHAETAATGRFSRDQWGLDETEWKRYQSLMTGIRASISPATLSPIEVLGIHATSEAERDKYAKQFAQMMRDDTERVLAFQRAYDRAWQTLNPSGLIFDASRLPLQSPIQDGTRPGDRLLLFVPIQDCAACRERLAAALEGRRAGAHLDIYLTGDASDDAIRAWAKTSGIDPADVNARRTTLNHERGELAHIAGGAAPPVLARIRNNETLLLQAKTNP
jgi:integrating conjugative element protein (TIGR03759 family)